MTALPSPGTAALVPVGAAALASHALPAIVARAGGNARFAYDEFFKASIGNAHTRRLCPHRGPLSSLVRSARA